MKRLTWWLTVAVAAAACGGSQPTPSTGSETADLAPAGDEAAPADPGETASDAAGDAAAGAFAQQAAQGAELYKQYCADCHGAAGEGVTAPRVVGLADGALPLDPPEDAKHRTTQFKTVADVADFVVKTMPPSAAGSLSADEYLAILAFDLQANGIDLKDQKLDLELAKTLTIPR